MLLVGSCIATTVYLSEAVHKQLKLSRVNVRRLRLKVLESQKETQDMMKTFRANGKTMQLRMRAKQLAASLISLSRSHKYAQHMLRSANTNVSKIQAKYVLKGKSLEKQMNATLQQLRYHVIRGEQLKALLTKNGKERALVDKQLKEVQDLALEMSKKLQDSNKKLAAAAQVIKAQRSDLATLKGAIRSDDEDGASSQKVDGSNVQDNENAEAELQREGQEQSQQLPEGWTRHVDKKTGRTFYYNKQTRKSSWKLPDQRR